MYSSGFIRKNQGLSINTNFSKQIKKPLARQFIWTFHLSILTSWVRCWNWTTELLHVEITPWINTYNKEKQNKIKKRGEKLLDIIILINNTPPKNFLFSLSLVFVSETKTVDFFTKIIVRRNQHWAQTNLKSTVPRSSGVFWVWPWCCHNNRSSKE